MYNLFLKFIIIINLSCKYYVLNYIWFIYDTFVKQYHNFSIGNKQNNCYMYNDNLIYTFIYKLIIKQLMKKIMC
jgi:hypothetical protein